jgi:hypothetical protein
MTSPSPFCFLNYGYVALGKVYLIYESGYVTPCVGNLTEENSRVSMFEFPIGEENI